MSIDVIRETHRRRQDLHRAEKSLTLQIKAICRRLCGGALAAQWKAGEISEADYRKRTKVEADKLYTAVVKEQPHPLFLGATLNTASFFEARAIFEKQRAATEKALERLAKTMPVAAWVASVKGLGLGSLAAIIGEAGDLSNYATHSKLWKRLGLAVIDGERQRRVPGDAALAHGYSPTRRAIVWNIGQCVIKAQSAKVDKETGEVLRTAGKYRLVYDVRKQFELERGIPKAHAHNRATRYMEKLVVRDLWRAWRDAAAPAAAPQAEAA
jgi:hypothetical protein